MINEEFIDDIRDSIELALTDMEAISDEGDFIITDVHISFGDMTATVSGTIEDTQFDVQFPVEKLNIAI